MDIAAIRARARRYAVIGKHRAFRAFVRTRVWLIERLDPDPNKAGLREFALRFCVIGSRP